MIRCFSTIFLVLVVLTGSPSAVSAEKLFKYIDEQGNVTFTDRQLSGGRAIEVRQVEKEEPERRFFVQLRGSRDNGVLMAVNQYFGPVEVELTMEEMKNVALSRNLPARFVVPARGELPLVKIKQKRKSKSFKYRYSYAIVFGDPSSKHDPIRPYRLPVPAGQTFRISQAFHGAMSHTDSQNRYAVDIPMPEGTPVHAARSGIIMDVANDFFTGGMEDESLEQNANYVCIMHDDGTMAIYAHLKLETLEFPIGTRVRRGQLIARSGNTGYSSGPHLHFAIQQNRGMKTESIPFMFLGDRGNGFYPVRGMKVAAN